MAAKIQLREHLSDRTAKRHERRVIRQHDNGYRFIQLRGQRYQVFGRKPFVCLNCPLA